MPDHAGAGPPVTSTKEPPLSSASSAASPRPWASALKIIAALTSAFATAPTLRAAISAARTGAVAPDVGVEPA